MPPFLFITPTPRPCWMPIRYDGSTAGSRWGLFSRSLYPSSLGGVGGVCQGRSRSLPCATVKTKRAARKVEERRVARKRLATARRRVKSGIKLGRNLVCTDCGDDVFCLTCKTYPVYEDYSMAERMQSVLTCRECGEETVVCRSCMEKVVGNLDDETAAQPPAEVATP